MSKPTAAPPVARPVLPVEAVRSAKAAAAGTKTDFRSLLASSLTKAAKAHPDAAVDTLIPAAVHSNPGLFRLPGGGVKTASQAVAALQHHFAAALSRVNSAIGTKVSALPPVVPTDDFV